MSWFHEPARAFARAGSVLGVHAIALALLGGVARADDSVAGGGARANPGDTVGVFELGAPAVAAFTLHGTLPVPPAIFPGLPDQSVFQVRDADGTLVHAQTEIVSRYPATTDGADVVEIIARVHAPSGTVPGDRL